MSERLTPDYSGRIIEAPETAKAEPRPILKNGFVALPNDFIMSETFQRISGNGLKVYVALLKHAGRAGKAWPSQRKLAVECGMSRNTVIKSLSELEVYGLIQPDGFIKAVQDGVKPVLVYRIKTA